MEVTWAGWICHATSFNNYRQKQISEKTRRSNKYGREKNKRKKKDSLALKEGKQVNDCGNGEGEIIFI